MSPSGNLTSVELRQLIQAVFAPTAGDSSLILLIDVPNAAVPDNEGWQKRRAIAVEWLNMLRTEQRHLGLQTVDLFFYENVESNNADLPAHCYKYDGSPQSVSIDELSCSAKRLELPSLLAQTDIVLAPTEFSATAPLKLLAKQYGFRAATLPGFSRRMIPALKLDYRKVHQRVMVFKKKLDDASGIDVVLQARREEYASHFDIRFSTAHASSGLIRERGTAGNLPSGEAYIVPNEGEEEESRTEGMLPVQFGDEVVVFKVRKNRAVEVLTAGPQSATQRRLLDDEPSYGNIAEVGIGVLGEFGVTAVGSALLDEKLGLHVAFGRSDHFGGATGPQAFRSPKRVVHIDWVYVPTLQPAIAVRKVDLLYTDGREEVIMRDGRFMV